VLLVCLLAVARSGNAAEAEAEALTLDDYFVAALHRSEVVASQSELIHQAEEHYQQATAALLPSVNGVASLLRQEPLPAAASSTSTTLLARQPLVKLTATQPLFRGFREFAALRQTRALAEAQNEDYQSARVQLFRDVAQNFYNVLSLEQDLANVGEQISQNLDREKEIQERVRIGRSRVSELLTVQTTVSTLRAQVEQLHGQLRVAREAFAFLSGLAPATPLRDSETVPEPESLETALSRLPLRPDVRASQKRLAAAQENVAVARGAHLPSVDLNGNYYFDRPGALKDVDWDVQIALTVPIYAGGQLQSRAREAVSQRTQAELGASQVARQAEQEIRALHQGLMFDRSQLDALEQATDTARKNYEAQRQEYRLGLVTNLEVLQALTAYQENQRALDRARYTARLDALRLQAATARRPDMAAGAAP
jgi:outer membrane protein